MTRVLFLAAGALALAACSDGREQPPAPVVYQGSQPSQRATPPAAPSGAPSQAPAPTSPSSEAAQPVPTTQPVAATPTTGVVDARGVTFYDGYQTVTARQGDTVDSMARRVGIQAAELAAYNGLSTLYTPLPGDELVLPARADGYRGAARVAAVPAPQPQPATTPAPAPAPQPSTGSGWSPALVTAAIEGTDQPVAAAPEPQPTLQSSEPSPEQTAALDAAAGNDPQPEPSLAPTVAAPAPQSQPEPVLTTSEPKPIQAAAPQPTPEVTQQAALAPAVAPAVTAATGTFIRPVNAPISRPFSKRAGPDRNDGVDFNSPAGTPVVAADSGTVVLVSRSLGGLGTIVLVRHENEYLTVYGRIDDVVVAKGDRVERGQVIAKVADLKAPRTSALHFEIRRGPESVDPEQFI